MYGDAYVFNRHMMEPENGHKYGRQHSPECTCKDCISGMRMHRQHLNHVCSCWMCRATRKQLDIIAATEEAGRHAAISSGFVHTAGNYIIDQRGNQVANISICDRPECGSMAKSNVVGLLDMYTSSETLDAEERVRGQLCPGCVGEFMAWWEATVSGDRSKAYSKPWTRPERRPTVSDLTSEELTRLAIAKGREEVENAGK